MFNPTRAFGVAAVLVAGAAVVASLPSHAAPAEKFPHATGRIVYQISNQMMNGSSTLTWADYGKRLRQELSGQANANGRKMELKNWLISDGKSLYMHNPMFGNAVKRMKLTAQMLKGQGGGMPMLAAPKDLGKSLGKATIAGKVCSIHAIPQAGNAKIYVWQNLPLKMEISGGNGMGMNMVATKVETGIAVPDTLFKVPAGMKVEEVTPPKRPAGAGPAPKKP